MFKSWLKSNMIDKSLSRMKLAKAIGCSKATVDKWLSGGCYPKVGALWAICGVLFDDDCDNQYLVATKYIVDEIQCG